MALSSIAKKLRSGERTIGSWISLANQDIAEILANAGFDWLVIDLEHSTISIDQAGQLIRTIELSGATPLVRLTSNDPQLIKRIMDAGAKGIIVPNVCTKCEAISAVSATRYYPIGIRGVGLARAQKYGAGFSEYLRWQYDGPIVIVQIENKLALAELEDILTVPGVDGFLIGPYDLTCSMGIPGDFKNELYSSTVKKILEIGLKSKCPSGIHIIEPNPELIRQAISSNYQFIAYSVDIRFLDVLAREGVNCFKEILAS